MDTFFGWWKKEGGFPAEKRYITLIKALLLALLPAVCCLVYCAVQGYGLGDVYLPSSPWNDELFYYKQVEAIVNYGYPQGYFGFNESHALKLSFAAWSPVLVFPWIIWGLLFGWNLLSPVICNILLMTLCCFLFVWLARPAWKQLGVLALLFCLYTPFVRYMLSVMPEVICFTMVILFYSLAVNYLRRERGYKLALLFLLSGVMTLMRPYLVLFLLLPVYLWTRRDGWKGAAGSLGILAAVLGSYAYIKHYFGAEYFAPLFFTDWVSAFFEQGFMGGIRYTLEKLGSMGGEFIAHTKQGIRTGLASGAFFAGYLVCMCVLAGQSCRDWLLLRRLRGKKGSEAGTEKGIKEETAERGAETAEAGKEIPEAGKVIAEAGKATTETERAIADIGLKTEEIKEETTARQKEIKDRLVVEIHLALSFIAMLFALLLMYKLTEGSKHLLTFMAAAVFIISLMETKYYKKAALVGLTFAYLYSYMAAEPYDYQVPFVEEERQAALEEWREAFAGLLVLDRDHAPGYENVVIWVFNDTVDGDPANTPWQLLYALPEGFGISCCMGDYIEENFDTLESRYLVAPAGGETELRCREAGHRLLYGDKEMVLYEINVPSE